MKALNLKRILLPVLLIVFISSAYSQSNAKKYFKKAERNLSSKNYEKAYAGFTKVIELEPDNADAYVFRGLSKYYLEVYEDAKIDFDRAIKLVPDYAEVYNFRGIVRDELGDRKGACEDWNKAFDLGFDPAFDLIEAFCDE